MPSALEDQGGWRNRDIANWFGDFTDVIMGRIGDRMYSVAPSTSLSALVGCHILKVHMRPGCANFVRRRVQCIMCFAPMEQR